MRVCLLISSHDRQGNRNILPTALASWRATACKLHLKRASAVFEAASRAIATFVASICDHSSVVEQFSLDPDRDELSEFLRRHLNFDAFIIGRDCPRRSASKERISIFMLSGPVGQMPGKFKRISHLPEIKASKDFAICFSNLATSDVAELKNDSHPGTKS